MTDIAVGYDPDNDAVYYCDGAVCEDCGGGTNGNIVVTGITSCDCGGYPWPSDPNGAYTHFEYAGIGGDGAILFNDTTSNPDWNVGLALLNGAYGTTIRNISNTLRVFSTPQGLSSPIGNRITVYICCNGVGSGVYAGYGGTMTIIEDPTE